MKSFLVNERIRATVEISFARFARKLRPTQTIRQVLDTGHVVEESARFRGQTHAVVLTKLGEYGHRLTAVVAIR